MLLDEGRDLPLALRNAGQRGALNGALAEQPEPVLDLIPPRGLGRIEVPVQAGSLGDPGPHLRVLARGIVVKDKVHVEALGGLPVDP